MDNALERISANPQLTRVYAALTEQLDSLGPYTVEVKQSSLHIKSGRRAFLGVHPRRTGLLLNIVTDAPLSSPTITKTEQVSAHRYHNETMVSDRADLEAAHGWITKAYDLAQ
jgi:hypothetical protein